MNPKSNIREPQVGQLVMVKSDLSLGVGRVERLLPKRTDSDAGSEPAQVRVFFYDFGSFKQVLEDALILVPAGAPRHQHLFPVGDAVDGGAAKGPAA